MVVRWAYVLLWILVLASHLILDVLTYSLVLWIEVKIVNNIIVSNFISLILTKMLSIVFENIITAHWELCWTIAPLCLGDELLLLWVLTSTDNTHALLGAGRVRLILSQGVVNALLVVTIHVYCFQFRCRLSSREIVVVTFIYGFVLGTLSFLTSFDNICGIALAVVVDRGDASNWWKGLLWVEFNVVHLEIPLWCRTLNKPSSNGSCISNWLRKDTNIWNSKIIGVRLSLRWSNLVYILSVWIKVWIDLKLSILVSWNSSSCVILEIGVISWILFYIKFSLIMLLSVEIILRSWNFLTKVNFTILLILTLITELCWHSPIWSGGYGHVRGVLSSLLLL